MSRIKSATRGDLQVSVLHHHTSHPPVHRLGKIGRLGCTECVALFLGIRQYLRIWTKALGNYCSVYRKQAEFDCTHDTWKIGQISIHIISYILNNGLFQHHSCHINLHCMLANFSIASHVIEKIKTQKLCRGFLLLILLHLCDSYSIEFVKHRVTQKSAKNGVGTSNWSAMLDEIQHRTSCAQEEHIK